MTDDIPRSINAVIVMGVSGSGKTTIAQALAARLGWTFEDGDDFHPASNVEKMRNGQPLTDEDRWPWLRAVAAEIARKVAAGEHVVIACSALKRAYRTILADGKTTTALVYLRGNRDLILSRLRLRRGHYMPPDLLDSQFATLEEPFDDERAISVEIDAPVERIVDEIVRKLRPASTG
jgi:gluconokinase